MGWREWGAGAKKSENGGQVLESLFSGDDRKRLLHFIKIMILQGDYLGNGSGEQLPALCNRKELSTSCDDLFAYTTFIYSVLESFNRKSERSTVEVEFHP